MEASVAQFPSEMGRAAVESAVKVIRSEPVPPDIKVRLELVTRHLLKPVSLLVTKIRRAGWRVRRSGEASTRRT